MSLTLSLSLQRLSVYCRLTSAASLLLFLLLMLLFTFTMSCSPGRGGARRRSTRKLTPLVFKEHVPNVSENTITASGPAEGEVKREDPRFKNLVPNYNPDIVFKDEEGTGADRLMTQRCKEKLDTLAISVMNQWPGIKLRVTEGWDEEGHHVSGSLHYEGRAVDVTTSDRDSAKYGMLARLAVDSGFDWVYYESRSHIHCSVKTESPLSGRSGGCFHGDGNVLTPEGERRLHELNLGEKVLVASPNGSLIFSEIILFLDRQEDAMQQFFLIETETGTNVSLTPSHLIFVAMGNISLSSSSSLFNSPKQVKVIFARDIKTGHFIFVRCGQCAETQLIPQRVTRVTVKTLKGLFAPLTKEGNVLVDQVLVSCYAMISDQNLAHWAFLPMRFLHSVKDLAFSMFQSSVDDNIYANRPCGINWYARLLYNIAYIILPPQFLYSHSEILDVPYVRENWPIHSKLNVIV